VRYLKDNHRRQKWFTERWLYSSSFNAFSLQIYNTDLHSLLRALKHATLYYTTVAACIKMREYTQLMQRHVNVESLLLVKVTHG